MFWSVLVNENTKLIRRRLFWIEIFLVALIVLGILTALFITVETNRAGSGLLSDDRQMLLATLTWPEAWNNIIRLAGWDGIGPLFLMILIGAMTAQEYNWSFTTQSLPPLPQEQAPKILSIKPAPGSCVPLITWVEILFDKPLTIPAYHAPYIVKPEFF